METVEKAAETIEAAIEAGLRELGVTAQDVMVEVLEEPSRGVMGIGAKPARVRIIFMGRRPEPPAPAIETPKSQPRREPRPERDVQKEREPRQERDGQREREPRPDRPRGERNNNRNRNERGNKSNDRNSRDSYSRDNRIRGYARGESEIERDQAREARERESRNDDFDVAFEDPEDLEFSPTAAVIPDEQADEMAVMGKKLLGELLEKMSIEATITIHKSESTREGEETLWILNISGKNVTNLIGRRGDTLASLQYILRLMLSRHMQRRASVIVDVAEYKLRRTDRLRQLATRMADQAIKQGRTVALEPMPPNERRIIHLTLKEREDVQTKSVGEGTARKVTISPARQ
jgi:spoIIIJ-associated protein